MSTAAAAPAEGTKAAPPDFKQNESRQYKSKAPKPGQKGFGSGLSGVEGFEDSAVICPWEDFGDVDLNELAQYGII